VTEEALLDGVLNTPQWLKLATSLKYKGTRKTSLLVEQHPPPNENLFCDLYHRHALPSLYKKKGARLGSSSNKLQDNRHLSKNVAALNTQATEDEGFSPLIKKEDQTTSLRK